MFVSINVFMEVASSVTNISHITQATRNYVFCWWTQAGSWSWILSWGLAVKHFFNTLAEAWSLNGIVMITLMVGVVVSVDRLCCWSDTLESSMNCLTARLNNFLEYISFQNILVSSQFLILVRSTTRQKVCHKLDLTWW